MTPDKILDRSYASCNYNIIYGLCFGMSYFVYQPVAFTLVYAWV